MNKHDLRSVLQHQGAELGEPQNQSVPSTPNRTSLEKRVGPVAQWLVERHESRKAKEALTTLAEAQIEAEKNIGLTALKLSETAIRASLVGTAMPAIGALATRVNAATTAVDQSLTNGFVAETYTHLRNRAANAALAHELHRDGAVNQDDAQVMIDLAHEAANKDVARSFKRMEVSKTAVEELASYAINHIADAKNRLS